MKYIKKKLSINQLGNMLLFCCLLIFITLICMIVYFNNPIIVTILGIIMFIFMVICSILHKKMSKSML